MAQLRTTRLYAEHAVMISGDQDQITFYHGLRVDGVAVQPDDYMIEFYSLPSNVAGHVGGMPEGIVTARDSDKIVWRIRGLRATDFVQCRCKAWRLHSINRALVGPKADGTNLTGTGGSPIVTSAGATFRASDPPVQPGDRLIICEPFDVGCDVTHNGPYIVLSVDSDTQITLTTNVGGVAAPFVNMSYKIDGPACVIGESAAGYDQIPFPLPASAAYAGGAIVDLDVEIPGKAIEVEEMANLPTGSILLGVANRPVATPLLAPITTAPAAGQILVGNAGATAFETVAAGADIAIAAGGAVTIQPDAVSGAKIADLGVAAGKYAALSIDNDDIAAAANIAGTKLADSTVTAAKLTTPDAQDVISVDFKAVPAVAANILIEVPYDMDIAQIRASCSATPGLAGDNVTVLKNGIAASILAAPILLAAGVSVLGVPVAGQGFVVAGTILTVALAVSGAGNLNVHVDIIGTTYVNAGESTSRASITIFPQTGIAAAQHSFTLPFNFIPDEVRVGCAAVTAGGTVDVQVAAATQLLAPAVPAAGMVQALFSPVIVPPGGWVAGTQIDVITTIPGPSLLTNGAITISGRAVMAPITLGDVVLSANMQNVDAAITNDRLVQLPLAAAGGFVIADLVAEISAENVVLAGGVLEVDILVGGVSILAGGVPLAIPLGVPPALTPIPLLVVPPTIPDNTPVIVRINSTNVGNTADSILVTIKGTTAIA